MLKSELNLPEPNEDKFLSYLNELETDILLSSFGKITQHPYFVGLIALTTIFPVISVLLFHLIESGKHPQIIQLSDSIVWYLQTLPAVGQGAAAPHTAPGKILGILIYLTNLVIICMWFALIGFKLFARKTTLALLYEIRERHKLYHKKERI